jgi:hypothetical protein
MSRTVVFGLMIWFAAPVAHAQPRIYVAATTAVDDGERGKINGGKVPSAGGLVGIRLTNAFSIEVEGERGFRTTTAGPTEAVLMSFPPTRNPSPDEIVAYGIRTRDERMQKAGAGWSVHALWRSNEPGRINIGLLTGVSGRVYHTRLSRTTTFVSPLAQLPAGFPLPDEQSSRRMAAGGFTSGLVIFVRVTDRLTVAPELRFTAGMITNDPYRVLRSGLRASWNF